MLRPIARLAAPLAGSLGVCVHLQPLVLSALLTSAPTGPAHQPAPVRAFAAPPRRPGGGGGGGGYKGGGGGGGGGKHHQQGGQQGQRRQQQGGGSSKSGSNDRDPPPPLANAQLARQFKEVRVIDDAGANLGVMTPAAGCEAARAKGLDLILFAPGATPPVCKIASLPAFMREQRELLVEKRRQERASKQKEIRCTARTDDHDLATKTGRIVDFLKEGRPVRVSVSLTMSAWTQEEPARREVFARIVRKVAEAGAGHCPVDSVHGDGQNLVGMFQPTATPRPQADHDRTLAKLAVPMTLHLRKAVDTPEHVEATVAAAATGDGLSPVQAGAATPSAGGPVVLPPAEVLRAIRSPKSTRPNRAAGDDDDDVAEPNAERAELAAELRVRGRNRGKAARKL